MQVLKETIINAAIAVLLVLAIMHFHSPDMAAVARGPGTGQSSQPSHVATVAAAFERYPPAPFLFLPDRELAEGQAIAEPIRIDPPRFAGTVATPRNLIRWVRVAGTRVNVRTGPEVTADRVTSYPQGKRLELVGRRGGWARVRDPETGRDGWMAARYVTEMTTAGTGISEPGT